MTSSKPNNLLKVLPPDTLTLGLGLQHINRGKETQMFSPYRPEMKEGRKEII